MAVSPGDLGALQEQLGIRFEDTTVLRQALVHRSALNEYPELRGGSNERLEFLGDAVLGLVAAEFLYRRFPNLSEGDLTEVRVALVRTETLAEWAGRLHLGTYLYMGRGEAMSGGRERKAILASTLEALLGAMWLDRGLETVRRFLTGLFESEEATILSRRHHKDYKSLLQESTQATLKLTPRYETLRTEGPEHAREFTVEVMVGERALGRGTGHSKQSAQQRAAQAALEELHAADGNVADVYLPAEPDETADR